MSSVLLRPSGLTTHVHSMPALETSAEGPSSLWPVLSGLAGDEALMGVLPGSPSPWRASDAAAPLDALEMRPAGVAAKVPVAAGLLSEDPMGAGPLLAAAAAAAAAARAAAAVLAALTLRYCMAADMALATRGGELWDSRASFSLRSLLSADSPSFESAAPFRSVLGMPAIAADNPDGAAD